MQLDDDGDESEESKGKNDGQRQRAKAKKRKREDPEASGKPTATESEKRGTKQSREFLEELRGFEIHLPSSYPDDVRKQAAMQEAAALEYAMRQEAADKSLDEVRAHVTCTYGLHREQLKATTQELKLRSKAPVIRMRGAMMAAANVYRRARVGLVHLGMKEDDETYRPLKKSDMKPFIVHEEDRRLGDSKQSETSWIWGSLAFTEKGDLKEGIKKHIVESE